MPVRGAILLTTILCSVALATLILPNEEWPGTYGTVSGYDGKLYRYWLPDTCRTIRGLYLTEAYDNIGHDESCALGLLRYAFIQYSGDPSRNYSDNTLKAPTAQQLLDFIAAAAGKTGHPELVNCPMVWNGQFDNAWISSSFRGRVIGQRRWGGGSDDTPLFESREESSYGKPSVPFANRGSMYTWSVMWGWGHGWYSCRDLWWPWVSELVRLRVPGNWNPRSGRPTLLNIPQDSVWLGDPASVFGDWPEIAPYGQYTKSKSSAAWLPGKNFAYVWRAYSSRHPSETQMDQGEGIVGGAASTYGLSGQPNFMVTSPSRPYNQKKVGGKNYPAVRIDTLLAITGAEFGVIANRPGPNLVKVDLYDGAFGLGQFTPNAYKIYKTQPVNLRPVAGVHSLLAVVTVSENGKTRQFTSRPATIFVTDVGAAATSLTPRSLSVHRPARPANTLRLVTPLGQAGDLNRHATDPLGRYVTLDGVSAPRILTTR